MSLCLPLQRPSDACLSWTGFCQFLCRAGIAHSDTTGSSLGVWLFPGDSLYLTRRRWLFIFAGGAGQDLTSQMTWRKMIFCSSTLTLNNLRLWLFCSCKGINIFVFSPIGLYARACRLCGPLYFSSCRCRLWWMLLFQFWNISLAWT